MNYAIVIVFLATSAVADQVYGYQHHPEKWHGKPAPLNQDGTVAETPEVLTARARHLAAVAEARAKAGDWRDDMWSDERYQGWRNHGQYKWNLQPAPLNLDGTVAETPEVQVLRARHLAALAAAKARAISAPKWSANSYYHPEGKAWTNHG